jgi:hypothetical protein
MLINWLFSPAPYADRGVPITVHQAPEDEIQLSNVLSLGKKYNYQAVPLVDDSAFLSKIMRWLREHQGPQKISHLEEAFVVPFQAAFAPPTAPKLPELRKRLSEEQNRTLDRFLRLKTLDDIHSIIQDVLPALDTAFQKDCNEEVRRRAMQSEEADDGQLLGSIVDGNRKKSARIAQRDSANHTRKEGIATQN